MPHLLSKSKYIRGLQCDRALWLDVHEPRLARYTAEQMRRFDRGREFEYAFKDTFPDGIDLSAELKRNVDAYPELTTMYLEKEAEVDLFEAGFLYDDVLVLADVVRKNADGTLNIYEVKSGNVLSETYKRDAALQHYVISHCRSINKFCIVYNGENRFDIIDLTEELEEHHDEIARNIAAMKEILSHGEPDTPTGQHCLEPYACPYQHYCAQGVRQMSLFG
ncbi:MAG: Dna2/Cas4 domain-containing protein [Bacteroidales bacterium]|nr:Dna2/Cas4 domain-containing protein [Bacteroidales bacterium]